MAIITLTSDMGTKDYYVGAVKGAILRELSDVQIVDITHDVPPFDIREAAFALRWASKEFPKNTIHIVSVDSEFNAERPLLIVEAQEQFFIGSDNGLFSLLFDRKPERIIEIDLAAYRTEISFSTKSVLVPAACHLARGGKPELLGKVLPDFHTKSTTLAPLVQGDTLVGFVNHIDAYGNVFTNIDYDLFQSVQGGRAFRIFVDNHTYFDTISESYQDVSPGEKVAIFGATKMLEIAINKGVKGSGGGACSLLGLDINDKIRIEFTA